jgi:hypothetical protein
MYGTEPSFGRAVARGGLAGGRLAEEASHRNVVTRLHAEDRVHAE